MTAKLKAAKRGVESFLAQKGITLSHTEYLELIARAHLYKDWNTAQALTSNPMDSAKDTNNHTAAPEWLNYPNGIEYFITYQVDGLTSSFIQEWQAKFPTWVKDCPIVPDVSWHTEDDKLYQHWRGLGDAQNILVALVMQHMWLSQEIKAPIKQSRMDRLSRSTEHLSVSP